MGMKIRRFSPLPRDLSLEDLIPVDHFYRRLEEALDLSFVRELVAPLYAGGGRSSVDPVVFFKLQLVMFFEGLRSERRLMRVVADRLSVRWYVGYDLHEPLPDHSSLTRIRERFGLEVFRRFFEEIVGMCFEAGLVRGEDLFFDATKVEANASLDSAGSRALVERRLAGHLAGGVPRGLAPGPGRGQRRGRRRGGTHGPGGASGACAREREPAPLDRPERAPGARSGEVGLQADGGPKGVSATDPDASPMHQKK